MKPKKRKSGASEQPSKPWRHLFALGDVVATPGAIDLLDRTGMNANTFIIRHLRGDFGAVVAKDALANMKVIEHGTRTLSSYTVGNKRLWIITEATKTSTILLLPEEY